MLVYQEAEQAHDRRGFRPSTDQSRRTLCEAERGGPHLAREQVKRFRVTMIDDQTKDHLSRPARARAAAVTGFSTKHLHMDRIKIGPLQRLEQRAGALHQRIGASLAFATASSPIITIIAVARQPDCQVAETFRLEVGG